ncbi:DUF6452 family protein [Lutibacter aestuarii]|uniref:DUF6452 family protein n=1 Tax=Lutibacter aestuarii TaxID=861111 RepID=A0ABW2Z9H9_9FLAO|nr:DUF6452 family protein [uncultured Lutibacter sp.]
MKKYSTLIILALILMLSCEKDDICVETTTPRVIILFNNFDEPENSKELSSLTFWVNENDSIVLNQTIDSLAFPIDLTQNSTQYIFKTNNIKDTINLEYNRKDIFVSRSCGYKTIFEEVQNKSNTFNWVKDITINQTTIENETATHITILH